MEIYLIRHGMTAGNRERRYIGRTDEALCEEGIRQIKEQIEKERYPKVDMLFSSPLKRCMMTAQLIYPKSEIHVCKKLKEMDFGLFENKNYEELKEKKAYQEWLASGGSKPFPEGESKESFTARCVEGFEECVAFAKKTTTNDMRVAFVVHGGTIMAIMEKYGIPKGEYYKWQIENAGILSFILS